MKIAREEQEKDWFGSFDLNGYLVVEDIFDRECIEEVHRCVMERIDELWRYLDQRQLTLGIGVKNGFQEIVQRQALRYEIKLRDIASLSNHIVNRRLEELLQQLIGHEKLKSLVHALFPDPNDSNFQIIHQSCVISFPNTEDQSWHSDGPHVSLHHYLPCHVFNVFIPLIDIEEEHGPTEIRPESHHFTNNLAKGMLLAKLKKQLRPVVKPVLKKGSILVFDYRVLHRGGGNRSNEVRPILVLTFAKSWYKVSQHYLLPSFHHHDMDIIQDNLNFPARSIFDPVSLPSQEIKTTEESESSLTTNDCLKDPIL